MSSKLKGKTLLQALRAKVAKTHSQALGAKVAKTHSAAPKEPRILQHPQTRTVAQSLFKNCRIK